MKRTLLLTLMAMLIICETGLAEPFWEGAVYNDNLGTMVPNVVTFDWASSGSGVAPDLGPPGSPLTVGEDFDFKYQSFLFALNDSGGQTLAFPGLNADFEYTVVANIPETVLAMVGTTALFITRSGGEFLIYHDSTPNADVGTGLGFDDGDLVARGSISPGQLSTFTQTGPGEGIGSTILTGVIDSSDPAYLDPAFTIVSFRFEGTLNIPALDSTTAAFFLSRAGEGALPDYTVGGRADLLFKVDASHKFIEEIDGEENCRVTAGGVESVEDFIATMPCMTYFNKKGELVFDPQTCAVQDSTPPKLKGHEKKVLGKPPTEVNGSGFKDTWGGQAGASGIDGNWTHHHAVSPAKSFLFHSNDLTAIACSDCDNPPCAPAAANATCRQIDFQGIGRFANEKGFDPPIEKGIDYCFTVHLEDIGEPGPGGKWPSSTDPCTHIPGTPINNSVDCVDCSDYYEIRVFGNTECTGTPIYINGLDAAKPEPTGGYFIRSGNVQMHPGK